VDIFDRYVLLTGSYSKEKIEKLIICTIEIASKLHDVYPFEAEEVFPKKVNQDYYLEKIKI
jgi:hypothetical protein